MSIQPQDRVHRIGLPQCAIVLEVSEDGAALVHWGTSDRRPVTEWIPLLDLEPFDEEVAGAETRRHRQENPGDGTGVTGGPGALPAVPGAAADLAAGVRDGVGEPGVLGGNRRPSLARFRDERDSDRRTNSSDGEWLADDVELVQPYPHDQSQSLEGDLMTDVQDPSDEPEGEVVEEIIEETIVVEEPAGDAPTDVPPAPEPPAPAPEPEPAPADPEPAPDPAPATPTDPPAEG